MSSQQGLVAWLARDKHAGFIKSAAGERLFFRLDDVVGSIRPDIGDLIEYEETTYRELPAAGKVRVIQQGLAGPAPALDEIAEWKSDAKLEDVIRYFYAIDELRRLEDGSRCYVIGRKGTGKTAIAEYLYLSASSTTVATKLSFKNFPFNSLYALDNPQYTTPNQYITIWKFLIYSSVVATLLSVESLPGSLRKELVDLYGNDNDPPLARRVSRWTKRTAGLSVLGSGLQIETGTTHLPNSLTWIERTRLLEDKLRQVSLELTCRIIFDELDEDYKGPAASSGTASYEALITSLFKAVQDVKATLSDTSLKIQPVVFLRDDIYDVIHDADKTKWNDLSIGLNWNPSKLRRMVAFRISAAAAEAVDESDFDTCWYSVFDGRPLGFGQQIESFDIITQHSLWRPRDYVRYMRICAEDAVDSHLSKITRDIVFRNQEKFSGYLRTEFESEMFGILPTIHQIFDVISAIGTETFTLQKFAKHYDEHVLRGLVPPADHESILKILFHFSVVGKRIRKGGVRFRYAHASAPFSATIPFVVHRGLRKALLIE